MRFYIGQHRFYCGVDLHAKSMYVCILDAEGIVVVHRNLRSEPKSFLELIAPYREGLVVAAECTFTWYWLADLCARAGQGALDPGAQDRAGGVLHPGAEDRVLRGEVPGRVNGRGRGEPVV